MILHIYILYIYVKGHIYINIYVEDHVSSFKQLRGSSFEHPHDELKFRNLLACCCGSSFLFAMDKASSTNFSALD